MKAIGAYLIKLLHYFFALTALVNILHQIYVAFATLLVLAVTNVPDPGRTNTPWGCLTQVQQQFFAYNN